MKKVKTILATALVAAFAFTSCNENPHKAEDSKDVAEKKNDDKFENRAAEKDAQFMVDAATISMEEIGLGELAQKNGGNEAVKDLGKMMVTDHQKALDEAKALAAKKSVSIPETVNDKTKEDMEKFAKKNPKEFDKDYCDKMVDGHKDAISKFEKFAEDGQDQDIKNWAAATLPTLRAHLEHAKACREKCNKSHT